MPPHRVVLSAAPGDAARLRTRPDRAPAPGEVEVAVLASASGREHALVALGRAAAPRPLVPGGHLLALPAGLSPGQAMAIGTPGLAAIAAAEALDEHGMLPEAGEVLVTSATGGLGALAVLALRCGDDRVVALTRRPELGALGAAEVRPLEALRAAEGGWAGALDVLGGQALARLVAGLRRGGAVVALGEVAAGAVRTPLAPFTCRGAGLLGLDLRCAARSRRAAAWARWAERGPAGLEALTTVVGLEAAPEAARDLLAGRPRGRIVLRLGPVG